MINFIRILLRKGLAFSRMTEPQNPRPLILCGPSGSGKSTLLKKMIKDFPESFGFGISHTTRPPRPGEVNGKDYHFIAKDDMQKAIAKGQFLENATFCNNLYGISKSAVGVVQKAGKVCVLDIDVEGVKQVKNTDLNPWIVFIKPPSLQELEARLVSRKTETAESLARRLAVASKELDYGTEKNFHVIIVNDNFEEAYKVLKKFVQNEVLKN